MSEQTLVEFFNAGLGFWIIYGLVATVLWLRGRGKTRRAIATAETVLKERKICSCGHGRAMHDRIEGRFNCHAQARQAVNWRGDGTPNKWKYVDCKCRSYDGPITTQEMLDRATYPTMIED